MRVPCALSPNNIIDLLIVFEVVSWSCQMIAPSPRQLILILLLEAIARWFYSGTIVRAATIWQSTDSRWSRRPWIINYNKLLRHHRCGRRLLSYSPIINCYNTRWEPIRIKRNKAHLRRHRCGRRLSEPKCKTGIYTTSNVSHLSYKLIEKENETTSHYWTVLSNTMTLPKDEGALFICHPALVLINCIAF